MPFVAARSYRGLEPAGALYGAGLAFSATRSQLRAPHPSHVNAPGLHPLCRVDPRADTETIETELLYADLEQAERRLERASKAAKGGDRREVAEAGWLEELIGALQAGRPARSVPPPEAAPDAMMLL